MDVERVPTASTADDPDRRTVKAFLRRIRDKAPRAERWLYSSAGHWRSIGNPDVNGLADALWQARWDGQRHTCKRPNLPKVPPRAGFAGFGTTPLWQFGTLKVVVEGRRKSIDGNVFYGTEAQLVKAFTGRKPRPPLEQRPRYVECYDDVIDEVLAVGDVTGDGGTCATGADTAWRDIAAELESMRLASP